MKRKRLLCLLLAGILLLSGCYYEAAQQDEPATDSASTEPTAEPAREIKPLGLAYVPESGLNPFHCISLTNRPIFSLVYESLFVLNSDFEPEPVLCDSFTVSDEGKTYTFRLCAEARFSDGSPVTAEDAAASLSAADGSEYYGSRFDRVKSFSAQEDGTLVVTLSAAYENLPLLLDVPIVKASGVNARLPIGSGPYFARLSPSGGSLQCNVNWWQDAIRPVDADSIPLTRVVTPTDLRDSFEFGSASLVCTDPNSPSAVGYRCDYELFNCSTTVMQYIGFNLGSRLFSGQAIRAAVTHVLDRSAIVKDIYNGFAEAAVLPCNPKSHLYDQKLADSYGYDPQLLTNAVRAAALPADATGTILVCSADSSRVELAYSIADILADHGLRLTVQAVDARTYESSRAKGYFDLFIGEVRLSGNFDLSEFFVQGGSLCYGGIRNDNAAALCESALGNSGYTYELYKTILDNGYICPVLFKSYAIMATRGRVGNLRPAVDNVFHLAGGRTLADASVSEVPDATEATELTQVTEPSETTAPAETTLTP